MRTAIISDLHLGLASGGDVLRDPGVRSILLEEIAGADRVVLLGDVVELRERALGASLNLARPFFEDLGAALGEAEVTIVPGNHDHRFAEPLLDRLSLEGGTPLSLDDLQPPSDGPTAAIAEWLGPAKLEIAYPGLWLRDDVYATHGHYMDAHLSLPRAECLAIATRMRIAGALPDPAAPADYERLLLPLYGLFFGLAQVRRSAVARSQARTSEAAWELLAGAEDGDSRGRRARMTAARAGFPVLVKAINRLLHAEFQADISGPAIFHSGLVAATEMARRLGVDGAHVITGHSHRGGPIGEEAWPLPGGGSLHNTGSWVFASIFHHPGMPPNPYWPGTVTWVEDDGPPRRVQLLLERSHSELTELVERAKRPPA
ncbi:MAG TPA: metallophosphoesterase [Solirubrobacterales bacterium]